MIDTDGSGVSEEKLMEYTMDHLADAACFIYEVESPEGIAMACMVDAILRYGEAIIQKRDPRLTQEFIDSKEMKK